MKRYSFLLLTVSILGLSCAKKSSDNLPEDNGCISRKTVPISAHSLSPAEIVIADDLFLSNNIDISRGRYERTYTSSINGFTYRNIHVQEYINGIPLFNGWQNFSFRGNEFSSVSGSFSNGTSLNTTPILNTAQMRRLFLADMEKFDHRSADFRDSCFTAQFGYYNLTVNEPGETIVKAWHLRVGEGRYPEAFYEDGSGKLIYYFNGIITMR